MSLDVALIMNRPVDVFNYSITHNLGLMAEKAGIYKHLWRPDELSISKAKDLIKPLTGGLELLKSSKEEFEKLNPENGWGNYDGLVKFVENYLEACKDYPNAKISVDR